MKRSDLQVIETKFLELADKQTLEREISFALQAINKSDQLSKCTVESKQQAVLNVANIGLTLNPAMNLAYLVPRYDNRIKETVCTLMPSYQGLVKLLTDSGSVTSCEANIVRDGDDFDYQLGTDSFIKHKPKLGNRNAIIGAYAVAHLHNGQKQIEIIDDATLNQVKEMSESYKAFKAGKVKSCVWTEHEAEMSRKTVIKRLSKYLPKTDRWEMVAKAIEADNQDYVLDSFGKKAEYIMDLARKVREGRQLEAIQTRIMSGEMTIHEANKLQSELENDYNPTEHDRYPSEKAISSTVKQIVGE